MAHSTKFLRPIRQSITVITSSYPPISHYRKSYSAKFEPLKTLRKALEPVLRNRASAFERQLIPRRKYFCFSGHKLSIGCILAVSVVMGSRSVQPCVVYAMDDALDEEEDPRTFWMFAQKFWLPVFLFLTVLTNLDHPIALIAIKIILLLLSTNPSPLSVYVFVGQFTWACKYTCLLREVGSTNTYVKRASLHQLDAHSMIAVFLSLYAKNVEVQDYKLLCIARVELKEEKFTLVGILGGWWALPRLFSQGFPMVGDRALKHY